MKKEGLKKDFKRKLNLKKREKNKTPSYLIIKKKNYLLGVKIEMKKKGSDEDDLLDATWT